MLQTLLAIVVLGQVLPGLAEPPLAQAPQISGIEVLEVTATTATIGWQVAPAASGVIEYGQTDDYGTHSTLESTALDAHRQELGDLRPGTVYHFRIHGSTPDGLTGVSPDQRFETAPLAPQAEAPTGIYGTGVAADVKNNKPIDGRRLAHRFRASTTSELTSVRVQQRGGPVYSSGDGGILEVSLQTDDGSEAHRPSGTALASLRVRPGNPDGDWTTFEQWVFPQPARLTAGELYHVVFENRADEPLRDYISLNELLTYSPESPRQQAFDDTYAVLYDEGDGWQLQRRDSADMDLVYADGSHDGIGYIETMCGRYGVVSGLDQMVREYFTVTVRDRPVTSVSIRVKRTSGDDPLVIDLEQEDGTVLAVGEVPAADVARADPGCTDDGSGWVVLDFDEPVVLEAGSTYALRLSTARTSQYTAEPIREGTDEGLGSYRFTDGDAQRSTDGGDSWTALYRWSPVDLQFFFEPAR